jgi:hypothetical protein
LAFSPELTDKVLKQTLLALDRYGSIRQAAKHLGVTRSAIDNRLIKAAQRGLLTADKPKPPEQPESPFAVEHPPQAATVNGAAWELVSRPDNTFCFGAMGDLHAASKYTRWEVREDLMNRAVDAGAQCIFDTGNWIDGEKPFNRYDLEVVGLDAQVKLLAKKYPRVKVPTFAITGDDHEGWYIKSEGIDVGRYCESIMRDEGHNWTNLGYMEADIVLRNANSGAVATLRVVHPGGGTGYALSYRPQKIIESYEGGEKPSVVLFGHYHKLDCNNIRNVWSVQTGCAQDQTPFMRKKSLEAHVGGAIIQMEQDPKTGAIIGFRPDLRRYFNRAYYVSEGKANNRWSVGKVDMIPRKMNTAK